MNPVCVFRKLQVSITQQASVFNQAVTLCRATPSIQHPVWASVDKREYKSMPTHGIGRWKYLLPKEGPKRKKDKLQMKAIMSESDKAYGSLNVRVSGYDMTVVEHYSQYIHNLCSRLGVKVAESFALPTKSTEWSCSCKKKRHQDLSALTATLCPVFMDVLLKNQPEGVQLSVTKGSYADLVPYKKLLKD
ncbi:hypothetical protein L3Q82_003988 [Scortum barcoo]|uniref:Uncharacterized protein n=1 Tax=Scortum barcoo TaxID=214431 RepID=A0ACB8X6H3_9TELE|nr:hypothetical protein L3Q82_003988 [Scortum barcoo]